LDGFLCVDKPQGVTSRYVVNQVQRLVRPAKVGHAGTLDPLGTGVLVVALGRATRLVRYVQQMAKTYQASFLLGKTSDTEDVTGQLVDCPVGEPPTTAQVVAVCRQFVGQTLQRPPAFSALKVDGKRSYDLARAGKIIVLKERPIVIDRIEVTRYSFPQLDVEVECGSGTYIRSLGRDIGDALECGAVLSHLRRTRIGRFCVEQAVTLEPIDSADAVKAALQPAKNGVAFLVHLELSNELLRTLSYGAKIRLNDTRVHEVAAVDSKGNFVAVLTRTPDGDYRPSVNFAAK